MSFKLCQQDDMVSILRDSFKANIIRVPKKSIQPLTVLVKKGNRLKRLGQLPNLLDGVPDLHIPVHEEHGTNIAGNKSSSIELGFGLQILEGYLKAFGLPEVGFKESFHAAKEVSFSFGDIVERFVDLLELGNHLSAHNIQKTNPVISPLIKDPNADLLLVDSVLASNNFQVQAEKMRENETALNLEPLEHLVKVEEVKVAFDRAQKRAIGFAGQDYLSFAFTCVVMNIDPVSHKIFDIQADNRQLVLEDTTALRVLVEEEPEMLDIED